MNRSQDAWPARVRRAWIERAAQARGVIGRKAVMEAFSVCDSQASADLQAVIAEHPGCLTYDLQGKCYRWTGKKLKLDLPYPIKDFHMEAGSGD